MAVTYSSSYQFGEYENTALLVYSEYTEYEFIGTGESSVAVLKNGIPVVVDPARVVVYVLGRKWPSSWWSVVRGDEGSFITLSGSRTFPNKADCCIGFYVMLEING